MYHDVQVVEMMSDRCTGIYSTEGRDMRVRTGEERQQSDGNVHKGQEVHVIREACCGRGDPTVQQYSHRTMFLHCSGLHSSLLITRL